MKRSFVRATALLALLTSLSGCDRGVLFLGYACVAPACGWQLDQGEIHRGSAWAPYEDTVELSSAPTVISSRFDGPAACVSLRMIGQVTPEAQLSLELDYGDDGSVDQVVAVEPLDWEQRELSLRAPEGFRRVRVRLNKAGAGRAAFIQLRLHGDELERCMEQAAPVLGVGAPCQSDGACASGHCVLGSCSACGAGGCAEGAACAADEDCMSGGCAGGVCRACAASGSCGAGQACSSAAQCASRSCVAGSFPSLQSRPENESVCGECADDGACPGGRCVLGRCGACVTDADCGGGQRCRYEDPVDASSRRCVAAPAALQPRGALCESDAECVTGLRCGAAAGRAKRCGASCARDEECAPSEVCASAGSVRFTGPPAGHDPLPSFGSDPLARITTCWARADLMQACTIHMQCSVGACCDGQCSFPAAVDYGTGACLVVGDLPP